MGSSRSPDKSHMLFEAKVCDLREGLLWFVCGNFDVFPKLGIFRIIVHEDKIVLSMKSHNIHGSFLPPAINDIMWNHGLLTLTFLKLYPDRHFATTCSMSLPIPGQNRTILAQALHFSFSKVVFVNDT